MLPLLRTKKVMMTSSYRFKQRLWLLLGQSLFYIAIPGSSDPNHIAENYDIFDFELSEEDMQCVNNLNRMERYEIW